LTPRAGAALALLVSVSLGCGTGGPPPAAEPGRPLVSDFPAIRLGTFQNQARPGSLRDDRGLFLAGVFSDLYHDPRDGPDVFWAVTDRGPTRPTADGKARAYEVPDFNPALLEVMAAPSGVIVLQQLPILSPSGGSVSGLPNRVRAGESVVGPEGEPLPVDPGGLDPRGLVRLADGTFWLADTNGPSLVHLTAAGRVLERWLPRGAALADADYSTAEVLPAFLTRGASLESLAATAEGRYLYTMTSAPSDEASGSGRLVRLLQMDTLTARVIGEWAYVLESPEARLSALAFVDAGRLVAVETTSETARVFELDLRDATNVLGGPLDSAGSPEPGDQADLERAGLRPAAKSLLLDLAGVPGAEGRVQGLAIVNADTIAVGREEGSALPILLGGADLSDLAAKRLTSRLVTLRLDAPLPLGR
jgi:hypothetical protein